MSAQIIRIHPDTRRLVRADEEQRIAELEAHVEIARDAAERAWLARAGVVRPLTVWDDDPHVARRLAELKAFALWWDGAPLG